ncbi:MAG: response regulator [Campylobacterales bacterium]|nr:response regulator [Campylobacterales bacterium]
MEITQMMTHLHTLNVLVVEDGNDIRDIISSTFNKLFKNTLTAVDGLDGLEKFKSNKPDIVITDIRMPNMSGNEMIDEIKKIDPSVPIIVVTGHGRLIKKTNQADMFLDKPIKFNKLIEAIYEFTHK